MADKPKMTKPIIMPSTIQKDSDPPTPPPAETTASTIQKDSDPPTPPPAEAPLRNDGPTPDYPPAGYAPRDTPVVREVRYRVMSSMMISWMGHLTHLHAGDVIRERGYGGPSGIERLRAQGVVLERVE